AIFTVTFDVGDQADEPFNDLTVGDAFIADSAGAHVGLEFHTMKRMPPVQHLWIDESAAAVCAQAGDVRVVVDQSRGFDVVESPFDEITGSVTDLFDQLFRLMPESSADVMQQAHNPRNLARITRTM